MSRTETEETVREKCRHLFFCRKLFQCGMMVLYYFTVVMDVNWMHGFKLWKVKLLRFLKWKRFIFAQWVLMFSWLYMCQYETAVFCCVLVQMQRLCSKLCLLLQSFSNTGWPWLWTVDPDIIWRCNLLIWSQIHHHHITRSSCSKPQPLTTG